MSRVGILMSRKIMRREGVGAAVLRDVIAEIPMMILEVQS